MRFIHQELVVSKLDALSLLTPDVHEVSLWRGDKLVSTHPIQSAEEAKNLIENWDGDVSLQYGGLRCS